MPTASSRPGQSQVLGNGTDACATTGDFEAPCVATTGSVAATAISGTITLQPGAEPLAGYRLIRFLGQGGFGVVWEAEAPGGFRVALKFIRLCDPRADRELRALDVVRRLHHPHLLDVQFAVVRDSFVVLAMPLCDQSLHDRLRACRGEGRLGLPLGELLGYMKELAAAVDYLNEPAHSVGDGRVAGIQHRDIKPSNILLAGGSVRLADFGLAKMLVGAGEPHSGCMSPHYVAPEEIQGQASRTSDQYAVAVTYVQLRTGQLPFGGSVGAVLGGHLYREPDLSGLPEGERRIVGRALSKRPEARWGSCGEFVDRLARVVRSVDAERPLEWRHWDGSAGGDEDALSRSERRLWDGGAAAEEDAFSRSDLPRSAVGGESPRTWHGTGCAHPAIKTCPRRIGLAAMTFGLIGIATAMSSLRVTPLEPPGHTDRSSSQRAVPRHRRHSPAHQAPRSPRSPAGRCVRGHFHGRDELAVRRAGLRRRGSSVHLLPVCRC
jgi:serine/threonine protein kinase